MKISVRVENLADPEGSAKTIIQEFEQAEVTLGRAKTNHLVLAASDVSNRHAKLFVEISSDQPAPLLYIVDVGSSNGTFIEDTRLTPNEPYELQNGQRLVLGSFLLSPEVAFDPAELPVQPLPEPLATGKQVADAPAAAKAMADPAAASVQALVAEKEPIEKAAEEKKPPETPKAAAPEPKPEAPKPDAPKPVEPKAAEPKPVDSKPIDLKAAESKPVDSKPVESKPVESKATDVELVHAAETPGNREPAQAAKPVKQPGEQPVAQPIAPQTAAPAIDMQAHFAFVGDAFQVFCERISHDLRTPIGVAMNTIAEARASGVLDDRTVQDGERAHQSMLAKLHFLKFLGAPFKANLKRGEISELLFSELSSRPILQKMSVELTVENVVATGDAALLARAVEGISRFVAAKWPAETDAAKVSVLIRPDTRTEKTSGAKGGAKQTPQWQVQVRATRKGLNHGDAAKEANFMEAAQKEALLEAAALVFAELAARVHGGTTTTFADGPDCRVFELSMPIGVAS